MRGGARIPDISSVEDDDGEVTSSRTDWHKAFYAPAIPPTEGSSTLKLHRQTSAFPESSRVRRRRIIIRVKVVREFASGLVLNMDGICRCTLKWCSEGLNNVFGRFRKKYQF